MTLVPMWTERITNNDVVGEDHLGIETAAINYQGELLPGIITVTEHARYYSFYCWILWRFIQDEQYGRKIANLRGPYFKRLELAHMLACYAHHQDGSKLGGIIGSQKAGVIWREGDPINLDAHIDRYFQNPLGGFGQYYVTPMKIMGLIGGKPNQRDVYQLHTRGIKLAEAFERSIQDTRYYDALQTGEVQSLSHEVAEDYGGKACLCSQALEHGEDRELLREMLFRFEDGKDAIPQHRERRLSLALLLDMVRQSEDCSFNNVLRRVLYLGQYRARHSYTPISTLQKTHVQWQHVQVRQLYTNALQIMWHVFLNFLQREDYPIRHGVTLEEFLDWLEAHDVQEIMNIPMVEVIHQSFRQVGASPDWQSYNNEYSELAKFEIDALTIFDATLESKEFSVRNAIGMLSDIFLRFFNLHASGDHLWTSYRTLEQMSES